MNHLFSQTMLSILEYALNIGGADNQEMIEQILISATEEICPSRSVFIFYRSLHQWKICSRGYKGTLSNKSGVIQERRELNEEKDWFVTEDGESIKCYVNLKTTLHRWLCIENPLAQIDEATLETLIFLGKSAKIALTKLEEKEKLTAQLQLKNQQLQESEARFYNLSAISPAGIFKTDISGQCSYVNEKMATLTGLSREKILEEGWLEGINLQERQQAEREWNNFIRDNQRGNIYKYQREYEFTGKEGYSLWAKVEVIPQIDDSGKLTGFIGTIADITESKQLEADRRRAQLLLNLQNQILEKIANGTQLGNLLDEIVRGIESQIEGSMCSILLLDKNDRLRHGAAPNLPCGYVKAVDGAKIGPRVGSCGTAAYSGELVISPDLLTDEKWADYCEITSKYELRACWSSPIFSSQGKVLGAFGVYYGSVKTPTPKDIEFLRTAANLAGIAIEKQRAAAALHRSNTQLKLTLDATKIGTWSWNPFTDEREWDDNMSGIINIDKGSPNMYDIWLKKIHPEDVEKVKIALKNALENHRSFTIEYRYQLTPQKQIWLLYKGNVIFNELNQFEEFLGVIFDITEQKQSEEMLKKINEQLEMRVRERTIELQQQTELLQTILNTIDDAVVACNVEGDIFLTNPSASKIVGELLMNSPPPLYWQKHYGIFAVDGVTPLPYESIPLVQALEGKYTRRAEQFLRNSSIPEGCYIEVTASPIYNPEGKLLGAVSVFRDISEAKQRETQRRQMEAELENRVIQRTAELQQAKEAAETANRAKTTFLANMSHELRTPLNAILGFSEILSRDSSLRPQQLEWINIINNSGVHLLNLINDILEMAKIEAGRTSLTTHNFDLDNFISNLKKMFELRAINKKLKLHIEKSDSLPQFVHTDENKLKQVLINLLSNAIKFTDKGQIILRIILKYIENDGASIKFEVEDTGIGIPEDKLDAIFEPFVQIDTHQVPQEGTGLGLSISKQFVYLLGGVLSVKSKINQGSTFSFTIPVKLVTKGDIPTQSNHRKVLSLAPEQPVYKILLVEDQVANRQLLAEILQPLGFAIVGASNGQAAIELWHTWQPDFIWMDIRMPIMDGYAATEYIRKKEREFNLTPCKIVAISATAFEQDKQRILSVGCDDFVSKPLQESIILEKMSHWLNLRYIYKENLQIEESDRVSLTPACLQIMPISWIQSLHYNAINLDTQNLQTLLEQIPPEHENITLALKEKLDSFDFELFIQLAESALSNRVSVKREL